MQDLVFGPLFLTWGPPILAFIKLHPWQVFAAVLVFVLLLDFALGKRSSSRSGASGGDGVDLACSISVTAAAIEAGR